MTASDDKVAQLEAQLQKAKAERAAWTAVEKAAAEAKRVAEMKAAAEVEERRKAAELEARWVAEEKAAVARRKAVLAAEARRQGEAEQAAAEPGGGLLSKQKERAEGELVVCNHCAARGAECQVSDGVRVSFLLLTVAGGVGGQVAGMQRMPPNENLVLTGPGQRSTGA